jgi:hypothetical protein
MAARREPDSILSDPSFFIVSIILSLLLLSTFLVLYQVDRKHRVDDDLVRLPRPPSKPPGLSLPDSREWCQEVRDIFLVVLYAAENPCMPDS